LAILTTLKTIRQERDKADLGFNKLSRRLI